MGTRRSLKAATLVEANRGIVRVARETLEVDGGPESQYEWEFFCECGGEGCREYVFLTLDGFAALHDSGGEVLAPGHGGRLEEALRKPSGSRRG